MKITEATTLAELSALLARVGSPRLALGIERGEYTARLLLDAQVFPAVGRGATVAEALAAVFVQLRIFTEPPCEECYGTGYSKKGSHLEGVRCYVCVDAGRPLPGDGPADYRFPP